jgi:hypothetical protein
MKITITVLALCATSAIFSQTKLIHLKRHSGHVSSLSTWDHNPSNFGVAPTRLVRNAQLDSVILISDKVAVMVTSVTCEERDYSDRVEYKDLWSSGKDTVYDHVLFNSKQTEDEIRAVLKKEYFFTNNSKDVVLVGFKKDLMSVEEPKKSKSPVLADELSENSELDRKKGSKSVIKLLLFSFFTVFFRTPL